MVKRFPQVGKPQLEITVFLADRTLEWRAIWSLERSAADLPVAPIMGVDNFSKCDSLVPVDG
jgi:hypothetical protein